MLLYKAQLLSFIEYRTAAIYHACRTALDMLDHVQEKLLEAAGMSDVEALNNYKLAPLTCRRDIALLGLIRRSVLGRGPPHFAEFFQPDEQARVNPRSKHRLQLKEHTGGHWSDFAFPNSRPADYVRNSLLGLVSVYNRLPAEIVEASGCVSSFQSALQALLEAKANGGCVDWRQTFSPRVPWYRHPLLA